jgi:glycosyltransferase involved in cell wall biosynthesis
MTERREPRKTSEDARQERQPGLVSVIMPAYNTARFIGQAIRSVLAQTYTHWELLVIDDGSTDGTSEAAAGFGDARIRCIRTENRGLAAARNVGIDHARGEFIALLDSDDAWFPGKLSVQMKVFEREPEVALTYSAVRRIGEDGRRLRPHRFALDRLADGWCLDRLLTWNRVVNGAQTMVLRRAVLDQVGGFDPELRAVEDWDLWWRSAVHFKFRYVGRALAAYRVRPGSLTSRSELMNRCERAVMERAYSDSTVRRRFTRGHLRRLRSRAEATYYYNKGTRALQAGEARHAAGSFVKSLRASPHDVRQVIMLAVSLISRLPLLSRKALLEAVRK